MNRSSVAVFGLYLGLASSGWVLPLVAPSALPAGEIELLTLLLTFAGACLLPRRLDSLTIENDPKLPVPWPLLRSGLFLFAVPSLLSRISASGLPGPTHVALFGLVPTVVALLANRDASGDLDFLGLLAASLAGLAGALLLLPADPALLLREPRAAMVILASIVTTAIGAYTGHFAIKVLPLKTSLILMLGPSLVLLSFAACLSHGSLVVPAWQDLPQLLWGAAEIALLVWLVRAWAPLSFASKYLLIPIVTTCEGLLWLRPGITTRMLIGLALLAAGAIKLLSSGKGDSRPSLP